jgi:hypothetical protein
MKTEIELNKDIINITKKITDLYPELIKFISEMPLHISYKKNSEHDLNNLKDYYNSLESLLVKYSTTHQ